MKAIVSYLALIVVGGFLAVTIPLNSATAETIQRTVRGTVTATNPTVDPQTIVIKVILPNKEEMTVGARVPSDARITRGSKLVSLAELKVGESADLTYLKSPDGLVARSIHVR